MRTMTDRRPPRIALAAAMLLLASCSGEKRSEKVATAPVGPPPAATPATSLTPATPPEAPIPPETLAAVDAALAEAKAFNTKALADLAGIEKAERRIHDQAGRALDAARRGDGARVAASRADAEAAHKGLVDGLAAFRTAAAGQQTAIEAAVALCAPPVTDPLAPGVATLPPKPVVTTPAPATPGAPPAPEATGLAAYAGCVALPAEQALLAQNIEAVASRYQAAEAAYRQDRAKLEEAAATMALGR
jgi:hypothetical protein